MTAERSINAALVEEARALDARGNFADLGVPDYRRMIRRLADALEALEREAGEGWREIESAPARPMGVLLYYPEEDCHPDLLLGQTYAVQVAFWNGTRFCEQGTAHDIFNETADRVEDRPTHWRPLPEPPRAEETP